MDGLIGLIAANEVQMKDEKVNLFDSHVQADLMLIAYATPDGQSDTAKFPQTGFCENYLKLFVK